MKITNIKKLKPKKLIVFDLDGTLAQTKTPMDKQMVELIKKLLKKMPVAVIGGGKYGVFKIQLLQPLSVIPKNLLKNLSLFPTTATSYYHYQNGWKRVYALELTKQEKEKIMKTFGRVFKEIGYQHPDKVYGKVIEDRGTQITFSAVGQDVVKVLGKKKGVALKTQWKQDNTKLKLKIAKALAKYLPNLEVHAAGFTSIDVTQKGIDKSYGLHQINKYLKVSIKDMLFVGDAIFPGGNDYAITKTPIDYIAIDGPAETKEIIRAVLSLGVRID